MQDSIKILMGSMCFELPVDEMKEPHWVLKLHEKMCPGYEMIEGIRELTLEGRVQYYFGYASKWTWFE